MGTVVARRYERPGSETTYTPEMNGRLETTRRRVSGRGEIAMTI